MFTCNHHRRTVLGYLDDDTRIAAVERFFIIEQHSKRKDKWIGKHYYSELADVFRAYTRLLLRREGAVAQAQSKTVMQILDRILVVERKLDEATKRFQDDWKKLMSDPIERAILRGAA
jgi:transcription termination factor NusB